MNRNRPGLPRVAAAAAFSAGALSMVVFVTLFHAPMPVDAFAALGQQIAAAVSDTAAG